MTINGKLSSKDFYDLRRLVWQPDYRSGWFGNLIWQRVGFPWLMLMVLAGAVVWGFLHPEHPGLAVAAVLLVGAAAVAATVLKVRLHDRKLLSLAQKDAPEEIELVEDGVSARYFDGCSFFIPWNVMTEWRGTPTVILLKRGSDPVFFLPLANLSAGERETLLALVREKLNAPSYELR